MQLASLLHQQHDGGRACRSTGNRPPGSDDDRQRQPIEEPVSNHLLLTWARVDELLTRTHLLQRLSRHSHTGQS